MKPQLHWSHISMYTRCPEQYRRRYLEGEIVLPGIALVTGSSVHKAAEVDLQHKIDTGELAQEEEVQEVARDYVSAEFEADRIWTPEGGEKPDRDKTVDQVVSLATLHHRELAPVVKPVAVEREWVVEIQGYPVNISGCIDVDEGDEIMDWKTSAKTPAQSIAEESGQITMYSLAKKVVDGSVPKKAKLGYVVKTKQPKAVIIETTRTEEDFKPLLFQIERISNAIDKDVFPFAASMSPRPWWCTPKFCGYYKTCPGVSTRTVG